MVTVDQQLCPIYDKTPKRKIHKYKLGNLDAIKSNADKLSEEITRESNTRSTNESWLFFKKGLLNIMEKHVPSSLTSTRHNLPWLHRHLKKCIKKKHKLFKKAKTSKSDQAWKKYRKHKRGTQKVLR